MRIHVELGKSRSVLRRFVGDGHLIPLGVLSVHRLRVGQMKFKILWKFLSVHMRALVLYRKDLALEGLGGDPDTR